jgi:hypothetical protein
MNNETYIEQSIELFRKNSSHDYIPMYLPGKLFVEHFNLDEELGEIDHFFNVMCYELKVLSINPGTDEVSYHWEDNDFGLEDVYLNQLKRELKIEQLISDELWCEYSDLPSPKAYIKQNKDNDC